MTSDPAVIQHLFERLARVLQRHVAPMFKPGVLLTIIARTPGDHEADVMVSSDDDLDELIALLERSRDRDVVSH